MERTVAQSLRRELDRQESAEALLVFLTITHPRLTEAIRVVSDAASFSRGGEVWTGFYFEIEILSDSDSFPEAKLTLQNVSSQIGETLLRVNEPARLKIEVIAASEFDLTAAPRTELTTAEAAYTADALYLVDVEVNALAITGRIVSWNYSQEIWPGVRATQNRLPGLFR